MTARFILALIVASTWTAAAAAQAPDEAEFEASNTEDTESADDDAPTAAVDAPARDPAEAAPPTVDGDAPPPPMDEVPEVDDPAEGDDVPGAVRPKRGRHAERDDHSDERAPSRSYGDESERPIDPVVFATQVGVGVLTAFLVSIPLSVVGLVPFVGYLLSLLTPIVRNLVTGAAVTATGDTMGDARGALVWPALGSGLTELVCGGLSFLVVGGIFFVGFTIFGAASFAALAATLQNPLGDPTAISGALIAAMAAYLGAIVAGIAVGIPLVIATEVTAQSVGAYVYHKTAEPKHPGDLGELDWPGLFQPNHPGEYTDVRSGVTPPPVRPAMRF